MFHEPGTVHVFVGTQIPEAIGFVLALTHYGLMPLFSANFNETSSKGPLWLFWNSRFFVFQNFDLKPKYVQCKFWIIFNSDQDF
jgi:hypothetical protein